jgi:hypothetical protein
MAGGELRLGTDSIYMGIFLSKFSKQIKLKIKIYMGTKPPSKCQILDLINS